MQDEKPATPSRSTPGARISTQIAGTTAEDANDTVVFTLANSAY